MGAKRWVHDIFFIVLIALNLAEFFGALPADFDLIKKILSWIILGYLVYHFNLARLFFGKESHEDASGGRLGLVPKDINLLIIASYFLLVFKNMIHFISEAELEAFSFLNSLVLLNSTILENVSFAAGIIILLLVGVYLALKYDITAPSIMHIIHEDGNPHLRNLVPRLLSILLVLIAFFLLVFNLMMEWLAFVVDAPLIIVGIFLVVVLVFRRKERLDAESMLSKAANFGESFYENFLEMFYSRRGIFLALTGLLILHLLSDMVIFVFPYIFPFSHSMYLEVLGHEIHMNLFHMAAGLDIAVYLICAVALVCILLFPAYIWYKLYVHKGFNVSHYCIAIFFSSVVVLFISRVIGVSRMDTEGLVGVDIFTRQFTGNLYLVLVVFAAVFAASYLLSYHFKSAMLKLAIAIILGFVGYYVFLYSWDYAVSYISLLQGVKIPVILVFMVITILFYISSYLLFIEESISEMKYIR